MTTLYLVRHAHAHWSTDENRSLSAAGSETARELAARLAAWPIAAIYSSPHRRAVETIAPLAELVNLHIDCLPDLRERELPPVAADDFDQVVAESWQSPAIGARGGEANAAAQARALAIIHNLLARHRDQHVAVSTHGTLLTLVLNGLDRRYGYDFWRQLTFPDVYAAACRGTTLTALRRITIPGHRGD